MIKWGIRVSTKTGEVPSSKCHAFGIKQPKACPFALQLNYALDCIEKWISRI